MTREFISVDIIKQNGIYVHFPFCLRKCGYCDFFSQKYEPELASRYIRALIAEARLQDAQDWGPGNSIYIGGGTPGLMDPDLLAELLNVLNQRLSANEPVEISIEVNPGSINPGKIRNFVQAGVNRFSLGVQSLNDRELEVLGRTHNSSEAIQAVEWLQSAGIENISLDLIYGIPGQTRASWERTLDLALSLQPAHISCYLLQMDPHVPLARLVERQVLAMLDEDLEAELYYLAVDTITSCGFEQYELSNFARPGLACRHNLNYWQAGPYLGLGAGAVSFNNNTRYKIKPDVEQYIQRLENGEPPALEILEVMDAADMAVDTMILGLRLTSGVDTELFKQRYGFDVMELFGSAIQSGLEQGLLIYAPPRLALTRKGYFLSNRVFRDMLAGV